MEIDMNLIIDYLIPNSPSDFGSILFWILLIALVIISIIDFHLYLEYRKTSKIKVKPKQKLVIREHIKKSQEETIQDIVEIRNKVDKILKTNRL